MTENEVLQQELARLRAQNQTLLGENQRLRELERQHQAVRQSLHESEGRYRSVVEALDDGVVLHDHDGRIIAWNESAERVLGLSADQLRGRTSLDPAWRCVHPDGTPFPGDQHLGRKSLETGETFRGVVTSTGPEEAELSVADNGVEIPYPALAVGHLGMKTVVQLAAHQLQGTYHLDTQFGVRVAVRFNPGLYNV